MSEVVSNSSLFIRGNVTVRFALPSLALCLIAKVSHVHVHSCYFFPEEAVRKRTHLF